MPPTTQPRAITREIARVIKGRMASYNVTQAEMAEIVGVDQSHLSKMIRGLRHITIDQLERMCHMLGLDLGEVVSKASEFVNERTWPNEEWITPFVLDGERVSGEPDDSPTPYSDEDERKQRQADMTLAAHEGDRK